MTNGFRTCRPSSEALKKASVIKKEQCVASAGVSQVRRCVPHCPRRPVLRLHLPLGTSALVSLLVKEPWVLSEGWCPRVWEAHLVTRHAVPAQTPRPCPSRAQSTSSVGPALRSPA